MAQTFPKNILSFTFQNQSLRHKIPQASNETLCSRGTLIHPDSEVGESLGARWNIWMEDFEMFILASGITDPKRKRALLLYQAGQRVREIFRQIPDTGIVVDYETAKTQLKAHF